MSETNDKRQDSISQFTASWDWNVEGQLDRQNETSKRALDLTGYMLDHREITDLTALLESTEDKSAHDGMIRGFVRYRLLYENYRRKQGGWVI